jgi:hypothetical protein
VTARQSLPLHKKWNAWGGDITRLGRVIALVEEVAAERLAPLAANVEAMKAQPDDGGSVYSMRLAGAETTLDLAGWKVDVQATDTAGVEHAGTWAEVSTAIDAEAMTALTVGTRSTEPSELPEHARPAELPWETGAHVQVDFSEAKGVEYEVRGHPSWTRDAASRIETELKTRVPWWHRARSDNGPPTIILALAIAVGLVWGTTGALFSGGESYGVQVLLVSVLALLPATLFVGLCLPRLLPRFEVTTDAQRPKGTRNISYVVTLLLGAVLAWAVFELLD